MDTPIFEAEADNVFERHNKKIALEMQYIEAHAERVTNAIASRTALADSWEALSNEPAACPERIVVALREQVKVLRAALADCAEYSSLPFIGQARHPMPRIKPRVDA